MIELLIVIAIAAILAAIAYPLYTNYVEKSRRAAAVTALQHAAMLEEKYYATHNTYAELDKIGYASAAVTVPTPRKAWYTLSASTSTTGYALRATPIGVQADDDCGAYTLKSTGQRSVSGNDSVAKCWGSG